MFGINLHRVVRSAVNHLHPDVEAQLYQSTGQSTVEGGDIKASYSPGVPVNAQMQSESPTELYHADRVGMEEVTRKAYLYSKPGLSERIAGIVRPLSRNGDMFQKCC